MTHRDESSRDAERRPEEQPPGQFISADLQSDCLRFLREVKEVVRRRAQAGLDRGR